MKIAYFLLTSIVFIVDARDGNKDIIIPSALKHWEAITGLFFDGLKIPSPINKTQWVQVGGPAEITAIKGTQKSKNKIKDKKKKQTESISQSTRGKRCIPSKKCKKENGECIPVDTTCNGKLIPKGCKPKKKCKRTHNCCVQNPPCKKPKGKCKKKGGKCIGKDDYCSGEIIPKGCKKKEGCKCCIEECRETSSCSFFVGENNVPGICQKPSEPCDGDQLLGQCDESSDCVCCVKFSCPSPNYKCKVFSESNGNFELRCISPEAVCDGDVDCRLGDDEENCVFCATDEFRCKSGECVSNTKLCDGASDCSNNRDELDCNWSYDGKAGSYGPELWYLFDSNCNSSRQSPISLGPDAIDTNFEEITFHNYNKNVSTFLTVTDNPLVVISVNPSDNLFIQGGGFISNKTLVGCLFHWGSDSSKGSEHTINNRRYPMEMQLGHIEDTSDPSDLSTSTLTILSIMFEISETDNQALDPIIQAASEIATSDSWLLSGFGGAIIENLQLSGLLPNNTQEFYRYEGSFPVPPCEENQPWAVFTHTSTVSEKQLNVLRSMDSNNFRPLQPINGRPVFLNK